MIKIINNLDPGQRWPFPTACGRLAPPSTFCSTASLTWSHRPEYQVQIGTNRYSWPSEQKFIDFRLQEKLETKLKINDSWLLNIDQNQNGLKIDSRDFPSGLSPLHMAAREGQVQKSISDHFVYVSPWHFGCLHQVEMLDLISCHPRVDPNLLDRAGRIIKIQDDDQDDDDFNDQDQDDDNNDFDDHVDDWMTTPRKNSSPPCRLPWQPLLSCPAPQHGGSPGQPTQLKTYQSPSNHSIQSTILV